MKLKKRQSNRKSSTHFLELEKNYKNSYTNYTLYTYRTKVVSNASIAISIAMIDCQLSPFVNFAPTCRFPNSSPDDATASLCTAPRGRWQGYIFR